MRSRSSSPRDQVVIATKAFYPVERRSERSRPVAQASLRRHRRLAPPARRWTTSISTRSTASIPRRRSRRRCAALHDIVKPGKARYIGASSMSAWQFAKMLYVPIATAGRASSRCRTTTTWSTARRSARCCRSAGRRASASSPGARSPAASSPAIGARMISATRRARRPTSSRSELYFTDADFTVADRVVELAARLGVKPTQIALAWLLAQPDVTAPIVGASKIAHTRRCGGRAERCRLSADDVAFLEEAYQPHRVLGFDLPPRR